MGDGLIDGVLVTPLRRIANPKGDVLHAMKCSQPGFAGFGEAYFSTVAPGEIKGWKRHRQVTLNLVVPVGRIRFVVHDDRSGSRSRGHFEDVVLGIERYARLTVSPGLWLAFSGQGDSPSLLLNITDQEHDPAEADNVDLQAFDFQW